MKNGHTGIGTQRYMCKECGNTYCNIEGGLIIRNTKLDNSKWMAFAECFIDGLSCKRTAEKIRVTPRTAWFMRVRTLEALQKNLPSFEVKADSGADIDEIFFPESFKGISFKNLGRMPREPRREGHGTRTRGISNEQICVVTGINDNGDMFYDVACRGRLDRMTAMRTLESRISDGAMINTDRHNAYPEVLFKLGTAFHNAYSSSDHKSLERINDLHSSIRGFMRKFKGVSTKWLHCYLAWFKWLREFGRSGAVMEDIAAGQIRSGDYEHLWKNIDRMPLPFRDMDLKAVKN